MSDESKALEDYPNILKDKMEKVDYNINQSPNDIEFTDLINKKDEYSSSNLLKVFAFGKEIKDKLKDIVYEKNEEGKLEKKNKKLKKEQVDKYDPNINLASKISSQCQNGYLNVYDNTKNKNINFKNSTYMALNNVSKLFNNGFIEENVIEKFITKKKKNYILRVLFIFFFILIIIYLIIILI